MSAPSGPAGGLDRRGLLRTAGAGAAALLAASACGGHDKPSAAKSGPPSRSASPPPSPSPSPTQSAAPHTKPVKTLADYRAQVPGPAYPSNGVALTIDDGPHPVWTPKILGLLEKYHVPATFCMIGNQVLGHESVGRSVATAGHHIANHSWSHPSPMHTVPLPRMHQEVVWAQEKIVAATGYTPKLFRSPGGDWSPEVYQQIATYNLVPIDWSDDPRDWSKPGTQHIVDTLMAAQPGQILLCHDGGGDRSQTYEALSQVIPALLSKGYTFVSL